MAVILSLSYEVRFLDSGGNGHISKEPGSTNRRQAKDLNVGGLNVVYVEILRGACLR